MNSMMETTVGVMDAIFHRRAVRDYTTRPVEREMVEQLLLAAVQAPSVMNQQPWSFAVLHGHERLRDYSERAKRHLVATFPTTFEVCCRAQNYEDPAYDLFHGANTLIVVYAMPGRLNPAEDCCLAAENLMLAAYGLGLATCPVGYVRPWFDLMETKRELGVPEHHTAVLPIVVGYATAVTPAPERNAPNVVSWKWDQP